MGHNYGHEARCIGCRRDPGTALKKLRGHLQRLHWKAVLREVHELIDSWDGVEGEDVSTVNGKEHHNVRRKKPELKDFAGALCVSSLKFDEPDYIVAASECPK